MKLSLGSTLICLVALAAAQAPTVAGTPPSSSAQASIAGVWVGEAVSGARRVPFRLEIVGRGTEVRGAWLNGWPNALERSPSSSGSFEDGHLVLHFDYFANTLDASVRDGALTGVFSGHARPVRLTAHRTRDVDSSSAADAPSIAGDWEIQLHSPKGESAWKLHVRQSGAAAAAVILRIDGDSGTLYGAYRDGQFTLSRFTAAGPSSLVLRPQPDGTLEVIRSAKTGNWIARRPRVAREEGLAAPDDPLLHTRLDHPTQPLSFNFPDLNGKLVSNTDPRFQGKVVVVAIGGSWCPNCHDEAPFLEALYRKYHPRGLEIVDLSFEEQAELQNPVRLRAFIRRYDITYPVLLAGTPDQLNAKLPGVENLNCWPTVFLVGRDGLVKRIHAGFAGPATGQEHVAMAREVDREVTSLLAQRNLLGVAAQE